MPRRIFKRIAPDPHKIREQRALRFLGETIHHPALWHFSRRSVATAFAIGIFCAILPMPGQMVLATLLALWLRCNIPIAAGLAWATNPITAPPILYVTYRTGCWLLGQEPQIDHIEVSFEWLKEFALSAWEPLWVGSVVVGLLLGAASYLAIRMVWRWHITRKWQRRTPTRPALNPVAAAVPLPAARPDPSARQMPGHE